MWKKRKHAPQIFLVCAESNAVVESLFVMCQINKTLTDAMEAWWREAQGQC